MISGLVDTESVKKGFGLNEINMPSNKPPLAVIKEDILSGENFQKYAQFIAKSFVNKYKNNDESPNQEMPEASAGEKIVEMLNNFNKIKVFSDRIAQQMYKATDEYNTHIQQTKELLTQVRNYSNTLIQYNSHFNGLSVDNPNGDNAAFYKQLASNFGDFSESLMMVGDALNTQLREIIKAKKEQRSELIKKLALNKSLIIADNRSDRSILNAAKEISKLKKVISSIPVKARVLTGKLIIDNTNDINLMRPKI